MLQNKKFFSIGESEMKITENHFSSQTKSCLKTKEILFQLVEVMSEILKLIFGSNRIILKIEKIFFHLL
jgi:DNA gyrase/topoisomerase IV subunit B